MTRRQPPLPLRGPPSLQHRSVSPSHLRATATRPTREIDGQVRQRRCDPDPDLGPDQGPAEDLGAGESSRDLARGLLGHDPPRRDGADQPAVDHSADGALVAAAAVTAGVAVCGRGGKPHAKPTPTTAHATPDPYPPAPDRHQPIGDPAVGHHRRHDDPVPARRRHPISRLRAQPSITVTTTTIPAITTTTTTTPPPPPGPPPRSGSSGSP